VESGEGCREIVRELRADVSKVEAKCGGEGEGHPARRASLGSGGGGGEQARMATYGEGGWVRAKHEGR